MCLSQISDAGISGISDPGYILIKETIEKDINIEVLPGASTVCCSCFGWFRTSYKRSCFLCLKREVGKIVVFYELPHRIFKTVEICLELFCENIKVYLTRELTKKFEEFIREQ
jgi:16S rRNA (cytidine1402-2'-O)-methyltransferase